MKKIVLLTIVLIVGTGLWSIESNKDPIAIEFKLEDINNELGISFGIVSPTIFKFFNLRLSGGIVNKKPDYYDKYYSFLTGLRGYGGPVNDILKLYGEFGLLTIYDEEIILGCYGLFGFEFFTAEEYKSPVSYFIELGTHGVSDSTFSGFSTNVGVRYYF